jgi:hypothetical protein
MEEENEKVVEETTQDTTEQVDESKFESAGDDTVIKVDLNKPIKKEEDATEKQSTDEVPVRDGSEASEEVREENKEELKESTEQSEEKKEEVVLEEVTEEVEEKVEEIAAEAEEAIKENLETGKPLPENIQKLMDFMEETGGDLNDYVKLNQDYSKLDDTNLLYEYYRQTKPHLDNVMDREKRKRTAKGKSLSGCQHNSKLNQEKVKQIRDILKIEHDKKKIAEKYNISISTVNDIQKKRTWKWLK